MVKLEFQELSGATKTYSAKTILDAINAMVSETTLLTKGFIRIIEGDKRAEVFVYPKTMRKLKVNDLFCTMLAKRLQTQLS